MGRTFKPGRVIQGYKILRHLGKGGFGYIYYAQIVETGACVALKVESSEQKKKALGKERAILEKIGKYSYGPEFIKFSETTNFKFLAIECLGPSLTDIRNKLSGGKISMSTTLRVGIESVRALKELHGMGFLHRDIKPGNILIRPKLSKPIALIDFGLSRYFLDEQGVPLPPREHPGFVGTSSFASIHAHNGEELSQRDDLMSLFYTLVDIKTGSLPWTDMKDKALILDAKMTTPIEKLLKHMPKQFVSIYEIIGHLKPFETPNYDLILAFLVDAMKEWRCSWEDLFDWEFIPEKEMKRMTPIDLEWQDRCPNIPMGLPEPVLPEFSDDEPVLEKDTYKEEQEVGTEMDETGCCIFK